jgi:hypothetical protein
VKIRNVPNFDITKYAHCEDQDEEGKYYNLSNRVLPSDVREFGGLLLDQDIVT